MLTKRAREQRRRSRREGGVLIEGIIAVTMITIMFGGVRFFHVMHDRKGDTLREARYRAWTATRTTGCSRASHGQDSREVAVPVPMRGGAVQGDQVTLRSSLDMPCNEVPHPNDDLLAVLEWATSNGADALLAPAFDAVRSFFPF